MSDSDSRFDQSFSYESASLLRSELESCRARLAQDARSADLWIELGELLTRSREISEALSAYERAIELDGGNWIPYLRVGDIQFKQRNWIEARDSYRKGHQLKPEVPWLSCNLIRAELKLGELENIIPLIERFRSDSSHHEKIGETLATAFRELGTEALSEELSKVLCVAFPREATFHLFLGEVFLKSERHEDATSCFERALELDPEMVSARLNLGSIYFQLEKWQTAIEHYSLALEITPDHRDALSSLAEAYYHLGEYNRAAKVASALASEAPEDTTALLILGRCFLENKDFENAASCFQELLKVDPENEEGQFLLARAYQNSGQLKQVIDALKTSQETHTGHSIAQAVLGESPARWDQQEKAIHCTGDSQRHPSSPADTPVTAESETGDFSFESAEKIGLIGNLDRGRPGIIAGWAMNRDNPEQTVYVDVFIGNCHWATIAANKFRQDVARRCNTSGFHGFSRKLPISLSTDQLLPVRVSFAGTGHELRRSPIMQRFGPRGSRLGEANHQGVLDFHNHLLVKKSSRALRDVSKQQALKVGIIVLNRNGAHFLQELFESFSRFNSHENYEFCIVDHCSEDESIAVCEDWADTLRLRIVREEQESTFSRSNNIAARLSDAPYLLFLNNDICFHQDIIPSMLEYLEDPDTVILGTRLNDVSDPQALAAAPAQHLGVHFNFYDNQKGLHPFELRHPPHLKQICNTAWSVPAVTGSMMMMRREDFFSLNGFDERYFWGYEDIDLCLRAQRLTGKRVVAANHLSASHHQGASRFQMDKDFASKIQKNGDLFREQHGYHVRRRHLEDFLSLGPFWTSHAFRIGFAVTSKDFNQGAGDLFTAYELGQQLEKHYGWEVYYISLREDNWYDLEKLDALVVMRHDYDLRKAFNIKPSLVTIGWARNWFDKWVEQPWAKNLDMFWCSSQMGVDLVHSTLAKPATLVRIATNAEFFEAGQAQEQYASDYCFTGSYWNSPREIVDLLEPSRLPFTFSIYGHNWERIEKFAPYAQGPVDYRTLPDIYASTKLVIDDANIVTKEWGSVNSRVYDALAAGAMVITNGVAGSQGTFDGKLPTYSNARELDELIWKYLTDDDLREKEVSALQEIVVAHHTYQNRAELVFRSVEHKLRNSFRIAIKVAVPKHEIADSWGDYHFAHSLKRSFDRLGHSARVDIQPDWDNSLSDGDEVVIVLRGLAGHKPKPHQINLMWNISHPDRVCLKELEWFDHIFVASVPHAEKLAGTVSVPVEPLLQATDPEFFNPEKGQPSENYPVLFVGNSRNVFRPVVRDAFDAGLSPVVIGSGWEQFIGEERVSREIVANRELGSYYAHAGIVLNDHWDSMRQNGFVSNRIFDALACGATVISDHMEEIAQIFSDAVTTYSDARELRYKAQAIEQGGDYSRRLEISQWVRKEHSFDVRAQKILEVISKEHSKRMESATRIVEREDVLMPFEHTEG